MLLVPFRQYVLPRVFAYEHLRELDQAEYEEAEPLPHDLAQLVSGWLLDGMTIVAREYVNCLLMSHAGFDFEGNSADMACKQSVHVDDMHPVVLTSTIDWKQSTCQATHILWLGSVDRSARCKCRRLRPWASPQPAASPAAAAVRRSPRRQSSWHVARRCTESANPSCMKGSCTHRGVCHCTRRVQCHDTLGSEGASHVH